MRDKMKFIALVLIFLTVSFNITYWAIAKYNVMDDLSAAGDANAYIKMSKGDYADIQKRYVERWLMPMMVNAVRGVTHIPGALASHYEIEEYKMTNLSFGIVNIAFLTMTALFLFYFCRALGFNDWESLVAGFLFLTSFFVITYYTIPMVDAGAAFFIMAGYWAILRKRMFWLAIIFSLGMFVKETTLVLVFALFIDDWRNGLKYCWIFVPAILLFAYFSTLVPAMGFTLFNNLTDKHSFITSIMGACKELSIYTLMEDFQIFMFLWLFILYALIFKWKEIPLFIKKQMPVMALIFVAPFLMNSGAVGRAAFYVFPLAIPTVMVALKDFFDSTVMPSKKRD